MLAPGAAEGGAHRRGSLWATVAALLVLTGACADDDQATSTTAPTSDGAPEVAPATPLPGAVQELRIDGVEYAFEMDAEQTADLQPGWTEVTFDNLGVEAHQVMFARLKDGVDLAELVEASAGDSSGAAAIEFVDMLGGVSYIDADRGIRAMVDLPEGTILAMCYVPTADGVAHGLLGMTAALQVGPADGAVASGDGAEVPDEAEIVGTIEMAADGYHLPDDLPAGWYRVVNTDDDPDGVGLGLHELALLRLDEPVDDVGIDQLVADLAANIVPDIGIDALGGIGALSAGFDGYLYLDLDPGQYLAVDFMPDPRDPRPHMLDGYYTSFEVS